MIMTGESFKGGVGGTLGGTDTGLAVAGVLVGQRELSEVAADHIEFDFDDVEGLTIVDGDEVSDHLGHDDGITEVGLDGGRLLARLGVGFRLLALQVEAIVSVLDLCIRGDLLLAKRRLILALNSSTTCS